MALDVATYPSKICAHCGEQFYKTYPRSLKRWAVVRYCSRHCFNGSRVVHDKCTIEGCSGAHKGHGLCNKHYYRWYRHGDTSVTKQAPNGTPEAERFWAKVAKAGPEECWLWTGAITNGYGLTAMSEHTAHRWAWVEAHGPISPGMTLHHKCAVRRCVNPEHLELATKRENVGEMFARKAYEQRIAQLEDENRALDSLVTSLLWGWTLSR